MLVGEPTLMGGELGDEDERLITRLENTQYKPNEDELEYKPSVSVMNQSQALYSSHVQMSMPVGWPQDISNSSMVSSMQHDPNLPSSNG